MFFVLFFKNNCKTSKNRFKFELQIRQKDVIIEKQVINKVQ